MKIKINGVEIKVAAIGTQTDYLDPSGIGEITHEITKLEIEINEVDKGFFENLCSEKKFVVRILRSDKICDLAFLKGNIFRAVVDK